MLLPARLLAAARASDWPLDPGPQYSSLHGRPPLPTGARMAPWPGPGRRRTRPGGGGARPIPLTGQSILIISCGLKWARRHVSVPALAVWLWPKTRELLVLRLAGRPGDGGPESRAAKAKTVLQIPAPC